MSNKVDELEMVKHLRLSCFCGDELEPDKESSAHRIVYHCTGCGLRFTVERMEFGDL